MSVKLKAHYDYQPSVLVRRSQFYARRNETVADHLMKLLGLVKECNYGDKEHNLLRDRLSL